MDLDFTKLPSPRKKPHVNGIALNQEVDANSHGDSVPPHLQEMHRLLDGQTAVSAYEPFAIAKAQAPSPIAEVEEAPPAESPALDFVAVENYSTPAWDPNLLLKPEFLLNSTDAWEEDNAKRFDLPAANAAFREAVPLLEFIDWEILDIRRGYVETKLPLHVNSSNQYLAHQGALQLLAAEYTGGLAIASLFHLTPVIGFMEAKSDKSIYLWGAKASIKWFTPSCNDLICKASVPPQDWADLARRIHNHQKALYTLKIDLYNGNKKVAEADVTYLAQDIEGLRKDAYDPEKINVLYHQKIRTTAKLASGLRALEQEKPPGERECDDPYAFMLAGKHGITLAKRFQKFTPELQPMMAARTKHLDATVLAFAQKHTEVNMVNIGVGYDARFWRLNIPHAHVYELDLPVMLAERRKIFWYDKKPQMHSVPIDLTTTTVARALANEPSFNSRLPTLFIWEGGSMYFDRSSANAIYASLAELMAQCPASRLWLDYVTQDVVDNKTNVPEIERFIKSMSKIGDPFVGGIHDAKTLAKENHMQVDLDVSSASYLRTDEIIFKYYKFCIFRPHAKI